LLESLVILQKKLLYSPKALLPTMDDAFPVAWPLQNCESFTNNAAENSTSHKLLQVEVDHRFSPPSFLPGNEENVPVNTLDNSSHQQQHQNQQVIIKRMRIGGSPYYRQSSSSGRFSGTSNSDVSSSTFPKNQHQDEKITNLANVTVRGSHDPKNGHLSWDDLSDSVMNPKSHKGSIIFNNDKNMNEVSDYGPDLNKVPSNESDITDVSSASVSSTSHNYLDDFGKQTKGTLSLQHQSHNSISTKMHVPEKDPRFHHRRKTSRSGTSDLFNNSSVNPCDAPQQRAPVRLFDTNNDMPLFPEDAMEDPRIFLAPVIVPPAEAATLGVSSPWKAMSPEQKEQQQALRQQQQGFGFSSPAMKRSSVMEASHEAIASAQEAPGLAESTSQETSSSATMSNFTATTSSSMASALVKRLVDTSSFTASSSVASSSIHRHSYTGSHSNHVHRTDTSKARLQRACNVRSTPVRIKPRVRYENIQATDQGYASVAKLSAWLADDPTSAKKVKHVRRGANVIAKSRQFEKDMEHVIVEENNIATGAVREKKNWLQSAFSHDADDSSSHNGHQDDQYHHHPHHDPNRHLMMMRTQPVNFDDDCARSEFVVSNDAASSLSVTDKKRWLQNAFKKEDGSGSVVGGGSQPRRTSYKAQSDIGPLREGRDDITSRAKQMWAAKSGRRNVNSPQKPPANAQKPPRAVAPSPYRTNQKPPALAERMRSAMGTRCSAPAAILENKIAASTEPLSRHSISGEVQVEKDTTPVDFRAARELLIQRSKQNGNELKLASKVQLRTNKFERKNYDVKRRLSATGLLKPTWESNSVASVGSKEAPSLEGAEGPSDAYTKAIVEDIAPERALDELP